MQRLLIVLFLFVFATYSWADTSKCSVEIQDINSGTKYTIEQVFHFETGDSAQRKNFDLPDGQYTCTLAFFDMKSGTMLSCENKSDMGQSFVQSDRSAIEENTAINNLSFRNKDNFYSISSTCR